MHLDRFGLECLSLELAKRLCRTHIAHFVQYSQDMCYFHTQGKQKLVFVMDSQDPYLYLSSSLIDSPSLSSNQATIIRKEVGNATITDVHTYGEDRIIVFELEIVNAVFKSEKRKLVAELIPSKANLILLDEEDVILTALKPGSFQDERPVVRGLKYEAPMMKGNPRPSIAEEFNFEGYCYVCQEKELLLGEKRKKAKYGPLLKLIANKAKGAKRKIAAIEDDINKAKLHEDDGKYGDFIYMNYSDINPSLGYMEMDGERVELDKSKNASMNAQAFYKRAKRASMTIKAAEENLRRAIEEKEFFEQIMSITKIADENSLERICKEYSLDRFLKPKPTFKSELGEKAILPFSCKINDTVYLYGRNAKQNDFLTFIYDTKKSHYWLHVKDNHGAHVIIRKDDPSMEEIYLASQIAILASKLDQGEVIYCPHKEIRKGNNPGQVVLGKYQSLMVREISDEALIAFEESKRISL